jgi:hypothetical protein
VVKGGEAGARFYRCRGPGRWAMVTGSVGLVSTIDVLVSEWERRG